MCFEAAQLLQDIRRAFLDQANGHDGVDDQVQVTAWTSGERDLKAIHQLGPGDREACKTTKCRGWIIKQGMGFTR